MGTERPIRFLKPNEQIIIAPSKGNIGTLIEQELDGDNLVLTYQLIIIPQLELTKDDEEPEQNQEAQIQSAGAYLELEL